MNDLLELRGHFDQAPNSSTFGSPSIPVNGAVSFEHLLDLADQIAGCLRYWLNNNRGLFEGALIEAHYINVTAKSNRIKKIFAVKEDVCPKIVGARFARDGHNHIITYHVTIADLEMAKDRLEKASQILKGMIGEVLCGEDMDKVFKNLNIGNEILSKTAFRQILVDAYYVREFKAHGEIDEKIEYKDDRNEPRIVSIYDVGVDISDVLKKLGIDDFVRQDNLTALVQTEEAKKKLYGVASDLVAMSTVNTYEIYQEYLTGTVKNAPNEIIDIPDPVNEPVVGVIDTRFDAEVYFSKWVEYHDCIDENLPVERKDYKHGTAVTSVIVDGPVMNPDLDDGCGRFRVRHFAVCKHNVVNVSTLLRQLREIVSNNTDIHVWNLSLGSRLGIGNNCISPVAAELDRLQYEYNVVFIVAGTNKEPRGDIRIGSPADSINSIVVNSVTRKGEPASYSREGIVLSFFNKPDVCYYGGENIGDCILTCLRTGANPEAGTSFAAPWIARKMAYLMDVLGLSREVAKALLIDSATGWQDTYKQPEVSKLMGFGIVPKRIEDIVKSPKDEIKFIMSGVSEEYNTYSYRIPVPNDVDGCPYIAKATMCYFPHCDRSQGVDYSSTELDLYFGRIKETGLVSINENRQSLDYSGISSYVTEEQARERFRKWDNTKHIQEYIKKNMRPRKIYDNPLWGLSVKTKERGNMKYGQNLRFGIVVTLKEINGKNRIDEFVRQCFLRGWLVETINVEQRVEIHNRLQEQITLE